MKRAAATLVLAAVVAGCGDAPAPVAVTGQRGVWSLAACAAGCVVTYTFALRAAGTASAERSVAEVRGDVVESGRSSESPDWAKRWSSTTTRRPRSSASR